MKEEIKTSLKENTSMGPKLKWDAHNEIRFAVYDENLDDDENDEIDKYKAVIEWKGTAIEMAEELTKAANAFKQLAQKYPNSTLNIDPVLD